MDDLKKKHPRRRRKRKKKAMAASNVGTDKNAAMSSLRSRLSGLMKRKQGGAC